MSPIIEGRFWILKSWFLVMSAALLFSCSPAVWFFRPLDLPPAYQLKSEQPFADTAPLQVPADPGERSHGAKLTPRLFGSVLLFVASVLSLHPYLPATIGGCLLLLAGVVVGYRVTGDRLTAVGIASLMAGLYSVNACFSMNFAPKPFDGVALGMVALTMMLMDRPWLFLMAAWLACWCDERAMVSLGLVGVMVMLLSDLDIKSRQARCGFLIGSIVAYVCSRKIASILCGWTSPDMSMLGDNLLATSSFAQLAAWTCFEGGWIPILLALWISWKRGMPIVGGVLAIAALAAVLSCLIVLDISRAAAFAFPLIFAAFAFLSGQTNEQAPQSSGQETDSKSPRVAMSPEVRRAKSTKSRTTRSSARDSESPQTVVVEAKNNRKITGKNSNQICQAAWLGASVSLIASNFEVIAWTIVQPLPSTPITVISLWFGGMN